MQLLSPPEWADYQLIDSGNFEKLERFGAFTVARPEPQALWDKALPESDWLAADATFKKEKGSTERGEWLRKKGVPELWEAGFPLGESKLSFKIALSSFKHVGLFPEQAPNWTYIHERCLQMERPKVLNLFAYTGVASLAARAGGADVTHVDSIKQVISWARDNMERSGLDNIRWVVEDAFKFVQREARRGNKYQGIILDPPAYGRGPDGEKWVLEEQLNELLKNCAEILDPEQHFFVLNLYSLSFSALISETLVGRVFGHVQNPEFGELYLPDNQGDKLPLGTFFRFASGAV